MDDAPPTIRLDTTLAALYAAHAIPAAPLGFIATTHCVFAHMDPHPAFPREPTYGEDEEPVPHAHLAPRQLARLRRLVLGLKPQRRAFGLGAVDVVFFAPHVAPPALRRALAQLPPDQRHRPRIIDLDEDDNVDDVHARLRELSAHKTLLFWRPQRWMDDPAHACLLDPRRTFDLNSKLFLVASGIKHPPTRIISLHTDSDAMHHHPLPFVVKLPTAGCGFGTFIVKTEPQRAAMLAAMQRYRARGTTHVLLSAYIDLVQDLAVHFVVGPARAPHIVGVTVQTLTADGKWTGGHIDYAAQPALAAQVRDTVCDTVARLPTDFVGWAGVDIVVDRAGAQWVVDLNARLTGSMPVCLMAGHFWRERALPLAQFAAFAYGGRVEDVWDRLAERVATGQVVVTAAAAVEVGGDEDEGENMADVVWGATDVADLGEGERWIRARLGGEVGC